MKTLSIKEKITSFESTCEFLGAEPIISQVGALPEKQRESIVSALNEGWEPD